MDAFGERNRMGVREKLAEIGAVLEGDELTGRDAAIVIALWMGFTAAFGVVVFLVVFVVLGY